LGYSLEQREEREWRAAKLQLGSAQPAPVWLEKPEVAVAQLEHHWATEEAGLGVLQPRQPD
jgi:hypothetical protein